MKAESRRKLAKDCVTLLLLATLLAVIDASLHPNAPNWAWTKPAVHEVSLAELEGWPQAPLWIDARPNDSYNKNHISGAILLNEQSWDELLPGFLSAWKPSVRIVVYCDSPACDASQSVALRLQRELKLTEIYTLKGGWTTWREIHQ